MFFLKFVGELPYVVLWIVVTRLDALHPGHKRIMSKGSFDVLLRDHFFAAPLLHIPGKST